MPSAQPTAPSASPSFEWAEPTSSASPPPSPRPSSNPRAHPSPSRRTYEPTITPQPSLVPTSDPSGKSQRPHHQASRRGLRLPRPRRTRLVQAQLSTPLPTSVPTVSPEPTVSPTPTPVPTVHHPKIQMAQALCTPLQSSCGYGSKKASEADDTTGYWVVATYSRRRF